MFLALKSSNFQVIYENYDSECANLRETTAYMPDDLPSPDCTATGFSTDDGTGDGAFYCINGGTIGGRAGSCTCTGCNDGYSGLR